VEGTILQYLRIGHVVVLGEDDVVEEVEDEEGVATDPINKEVQEVTTRRKTTQKMLDLLTVEVVECTMEEEGIIEGVEGAEEVEKRGITTEESPQRKRATKAALHHRHQSSVMKSARISFHYASRLYCVPRTLRLE
jgi:hypothetical protein